MHTHQGGGMYQCRSRTYTKAVKVWPYSLIWVTHTHQGSSSAGHVLQVSGWHAMYSKGDAGAPGCYSCTIHLISTLVRYTCLVCVCPCSTPGVSMLVHTQL